MNTHLLRDASLPNEPILRIIMLALLAALAILMLSVLAFFMLKRLRVRFRPPRLPGPSPAAAKVASSGDVGWPAAKESEVSPATVAGPETLRMSGLAFDPGSVDSALPLPLSLPMKPFLAFSGAAGGATEATGAGACAGFTAVGAAGCRTGSFCACDCESGLGFASGLPPACAPCARGGEPPCGLEEFADDLPEPSAVAACCC